MINFWRDIIGLAPRQKPKMAKKKRNSKRSKEPEVVDAQGNNVVDQEIRANRNKNRRVKAAIIAGIITLVIGYLINYLALPAWNLHSKGFWGYMIGMTTLFMLNYEAIALPGSKKMKRVDKIILAVPIVLFALFLFLLIEGAVLFHAKRYANIIKIENGNFEEDIQPVKSVSNIALMDTDTAKVFGERALGSLSDVISQYDLSSEYAQINFQGNPMKVSSLHYEGFWKWVANRKDGIPGYVLVDPVNNTSRYVKLEEAIHYSPSEYFHNDLKRTLRRQYPSKIFYKIYFEIDEEGHPYYVAATESPTIGWFSGMEIDGAVVLDACTGESQYYKAEDIPEWVDVVYDGDYITERLEWNGIYRNGFLNSLFAKKGCRKPTDDFGYVSIGTDIYMYTGITSAAGDSSNIGVVLANERTCEIKFYEIAGADEHSAMEAAEGEVQQYGYDASFPSLINVNGEPTYIMVLKDNNNIVKEYAMVNLANYYKVVVADTQQEAFSEYITLLGIDEPSGEEETDVTYTEKKITVKSVQFIVVEGNTVVYITSSDGVIYKCAFSEDLLKLAEGDPLTVSYNEKFEGSDVISLHEWKMQ